jgi:hypothetical protein
MRHRERQNADYQQEKAEMEQTLNALERAIGVLSGAGTGKPGKASLLSIKSTVSAGEERVLVIEYCEWVGTMSSGWSASEIMDMMTNTINRNFVSGRSCRASIFQYTMNNVITSPALSVGSVSTKDQELVKSFLETGYNPQSETIQGILKNMYSTFATNLENATSDEMKEVRLWDASTSQLFENGTSVEMNE